MEYKVEKPLKDFNFWSGGKDRASKLTDEQLDQCESLIEELFYGDIPTETQINDLFWFDFEETICPYLGIELDENGNFIGEDDEDEEEDNEE